jgi:hypothetical protein
MVGGFLRGAGPGGAAVAGRPVGAAQAGIRQAHEGAEHDDAERQQDGQPGEAMEVAMRAGHAGIRWPCCGAAGALI